MAASSLSNNIIALANLNVNTQIDSNSFIPANNHRGYLKMYPQLNLYALKNDYVSKIYTFYCLRYLNTSGSGFVKLNYAIESLQKVFGMSKSKVYESLKEIKGEFYYDIKGEDNQITLRLISLQALKEMLGIDHLSRAILADINCCKSSKQIAAWFMATSVYVTNDGTRYATPITHKTVEEITGINTRTQQRYNKLLPLNISLNFKDEVVVYEGKSREYHFRKQLGNSYALNALRSRKGMVKKVNRKSNSFNSSSQSLLYAEAFVTRKQKIFFYKPQSYSHCTFRSKNPLAIKYSGKNFSLWQNILN